MSQTAQEGDSVSVHYTGRLTNGEVFDTSTDGEPLKFEIGSGQVIGGFDAGVRGMNVGDKKTVEIEPADAYGEHEESLVGSVPRDGFNYEVEPQVGMMLAMQLPDGNEMPVRIIAVEPDSITLDANHPLAGEKLIFNLELVGVN